MTKVTEANRTLARLVATAFGGAATVARYWDNENVSHVDVLRSPDSPVDGVTSYATVGLSDVALPGSLRPPLGVEMVGACATDVERYPNILATAAFFVINSKWRCEPGVVFPEIVALHLDTPLRHLLFVDPFLWEEELDSQVVDYKTVAWLLAVPISNSELVFLRQNGSEALEDRFEAEQIDIFDISRASVA